MKRDESTVDGPSEVDGPSAVEGITRATRPLGAGWMTTSASGYFISFSIVSAKSLVSSLTASIPLGVDGTISPMAIKDKSRSE